MFIALIWIVVVVAILALYFFREVSPVKEFIAWALNMWVILAAIVTCGIATTTWIIKHDLGHSKTKTPTNTQEAGKKGAPSRREALESAKVAWGLWHTGQRMRAEKLIGAKSLQRILLLNPESKESIDAIARGLEEQEHVSVFEKKSEIPQLRL